jgi:hypothetical protein
LRTLPFHLPQEPAELSGIDGFYVARLLRRGEGWVDPGSEAGG